MHDKGQFKDHIFDQKFIILVNFKVKHKSQHIYFEYQQNKNKLQINKIYRSLARKTETKFNIYQESKCKY